MHCTCLKKRMSLYGIDTQETSHLLYSTLGPVEIAIIAVVAILIFGVDKLGEIGGALGRSIREYNREKNKKEDIHQTNTKEIIEEGVSGEKKFPEDEIKI